MKRYVWLFLALGALAAGSAAVAAEPHAARGERAGEGVGVLYLKVPADAVPSASGEIDLAALLKRFAPAEGCSGGTCATGSNTVLSCPTSGGPTCGSGTVCSCICASGPGGSWAAVNKCEA